MAGLLCAMLAMIARPAGADGTFLQADRSFSAFDAVATVTRGRLSFGASYNDYDGGALAGTSLVYAFPIRDFATLKAGPAISISRDDGDGFDDPQAGIKLVLDRYTPTSFGAVYLLGEFNSIENAWFGLVQTSLGASGFSFEVSRGFSDTYDETTLALNQRIGGGPGSLRLGYRFVAEEAFFGFSVNTF
ncbi:hypothetical protein [Roseivivax lentus]|uniref:hypothetical protein n=1 Tax=Roseivivax lentus TaxID=633194 RepID=UPI001F29A09D|nr:hypothetical protein [Roseivivax lentus]